MTQPPPTSVDEIPVVCLEADLAWIFRLPVSHVKLWRRMPDLLPFPPLPWLDRQLRVSGCVVAWFLSQEARAYRAFQEPLEKLAGASRRNRVPWWHFTSPHEPRFWARPVEGEVPTLSLKQVGQILRVTPNCLRRAAKDPEFPMPPATTDRPLRWTAGQVERLLWAPPDHDQHLRRSKALASRRRK